MELLLNSKSLNITFINMTNVNKDDVLKKYIF